MEEIRLWLVRVVLECPYCGYVQEDRVARFYRKNSRLTMKCDACKQLSIYPFEGVKKFPG